jgi:translation initiation factor 4G
MSDGQEDSHPEASSPAVADTSSPSSVDLQSSTHDDDCPVGGHKHDDEGIEHATADGDHEEDEDDEEDEEDENDLHASLSASTEDPSSSSSSSSSALPDGKKIYATNYLLQFRDTCRDKPDGLDEKVLFIRSNAKGKGGGAGGGGGSSGGRSGGGGGGKSEGRNRRGGNHSGNRSGKSPTPLPPLSPSEVKPLEKSGKGWVRPAQSAESADEENALHLRKAQGLLNKLTKDNFPQLQGELVDLGTKNVDVLRGLLCLLFDKTVLEPKFCTLYSLLASVIAKAKTDFPNDAEGKPQSFQRLLLNKCQSEFEANADPRATPGWGEMPPEDREEVEFKLRRRTLGNMKFIGELYKVGLLTAQVMHSCVEKFLRKPQGELPTEEDLEILVHLLTTSGQKIESDRNYAESKKKMDFYIALLSDIAANKEQYSSRIRFMIDDVIEMRRRNWKARIEEKGPKTIEEVHRDLKRKEIQQEKETRALLRASHEKTPERKQQHVPPPQQQQQAAANNDDGWEMPKGGKGRGGGGGGGSGRGRATPTKKTPQRDDFEPARRGKRGRGGAAGAGAGAGAGRGRGGGGDWKSSSSGVANASTSNSQKETKNIFGSLTMSEDMPSPKRSLEAEFESAESSPFSSSTSPTHPSTPPLSSSSSSSSAAANALSFSMEEDMRAKIESLFAEYFICASVEEAKYCLQDLGSSLHNPLVVSIGISLVIEKPKEIPALNTLFRFFIDEGLMSETDMNLGFMEFFKQMEDIVMDLPKAPTIVGPIVGSALVGKFFDVKFVCSSLESLRAENRALDLILSALSWIAKRF